MSQVYWQLLFWDTGARPVTQTIPGKYMRGATRWQCCLGNESHALAVEKWFWIESPENVSTTSLLGQLLTINLNNILYG